MVIGEVVKLIQTQPSRRIAPGGAGEMHIQAGCSSTGRVLSARAIQWIILQGVKGAEQEDPGLQTGDESGAALLI